MQAGEHAQRVRVKKLSQIPPPIPLCWGGYEGCRVWHMHLTSPPPFACLSPGGEMIIYLIWQECIHQ